MLLERGVPASVDWNDGLGYSSIVGNCRLCSIVGVVLVVELCLASPTCWGRQDPTPDSAFSLPVP